MAARSSGRRLDRHSDRAGGGAGRWLVAGLALVAIGGGAALYLAGDRIGDLRQAFFAGGADGEMAVSPVPRGSGTPAADANAPSAKLAEMPALVGTDAASPAGGSQGWPALAPSALLDQVAMAADRALKENGFDQPPWRRFARPFSAPAGRPLVAILVAGLGSDRAVSAAAIAGLPSEVTLSFSPYAPDLADWIAAARAFGHEAMVDLPLQAKDARDVGALGLLTALNDSEVDRRMTAIAESAGSVFGFAGDGGDALLLDDRATGLVLAASAQRGLAFIDASGEPMSLAAAAAIAAGGAPFAHAAVTVDEAPSPAAIAERLSVAAELASRNGRVLLAARASPAVITAIVDWSRRLNDAGPVLAPASALLQTQ